MIDPRSIGMICTNCFSTLNAKGQCPVCGANVFDAKASPEALPPRSILNGRYFIGHVLGVGGFGITYLGWDMLKSQRVAVKEFFPKGYAIREKGSNSVTVREQNHAAAFKHWLSAFTHEGKILAKIKHLHGVVKLLDLFNANNTAYIVMDYLEGASFRNYLNIKGGKITIKETLNIMRPVMESLLVLHQYGIIHKDISPENIVIVQNKLVKLIDFGAASVFTDNIAKPYIVLKSGYSPIELYSPNMQQGPWSDIYQVGATIYNAITGVIPPEATQRTQYDSIIRPSAYGVQIPLVVENSIMKALAVDPKDRYSNMGNFIQVLYGEFLPIRK